MADDDDNHYLNKFLRDRLPTLGLDFETYGSYVVGLVDAEDEDEEADWDGILELLQASSESHSDDENVWKELKADILKLQTSNEKDKLAKEEVTRQERLREEQEKLKEEIALAKEAEQQNQNQEEKATIDDAAKQALMARYAYDESELYDKDGNLISAADGVGGSGEKVMNNKEIAMQIHQEKSREQRANQKGSKREEQAKTAKAKLNKTNQKEERRKRAQKGERRR